MPMPAYVPALLLMPEPVPMPEPPPGATTVTYGLVGESSTIEYED